MKKKFINYGKQFIDYKDKNLVKIIEGFKTKSELVKIIQNL